MRLAEDTITTNIPDIESVEEVYFTINITKKRHTTHGLVFGSIKTEHSLLRQANNPGALNGKSI
jgi:hypothetical protein